MKRYRAYDRAEEGVHELFLRVEGSLIKIEQQLQFMRRIWSSMPENLQIHLGDVLQLLQNKLDNIGAGFSKILRYEEATDGNMLMHRGEGGSLPVKKLKFALYMRDHLKSATKEFEEWQGRLDPSWYLIGRIADHTIDQQLESDQATQDSSLNVLKTLRVQVQSLSQHRDTSGPAWIASSVQSFSPQAIPNSQAQKGTLPEDGSEVLLDRIRCDPRISIDGTTEDVRDLAKLLQRVDPFIFGLLSCKGASKELDSSGKLTGFHLVFNMPEHYTRPCSLRTLILTPPTGITLNDRFSLAALLARSVFFMHTSRFVHKNIRPENIIIVENASESTTRRPFLVGFEKFRLDRGQTSRQGDARWERDLYRHPERQGKQPEQDFKMQHDIYSLGVVMLEIGLGYSFVMPPPEPSTASTSTANSELDIAEYLSSSNVARKAKLVKNRLVELANEKLPLAMGTKYTQAVTSCLTCLDRKNLAFGKEEDLQDDDGILVGVKFIEKVLTILGEIMV